MRPHRLLDRQLRKLGLKNGAPVPSPDLWNALLDRISTTYAESDEDRYLLERSLSISSREMRELVRMLESLGYTSPLVAADGEEALEVLRREPCDLVLMDLHMPRMDGIEATLRIRDMFAEGARPTIIALTADAIEDSRIACRDAGIAGFLTKPFRREELQTCLEQFHA